MARKIGVRAHVKSKNNKSLKSSVNSTNPKSNVRKSKKNKKIIAYTQERRSGTNSTQGTKNHGNSTQKPVEESDVSGRFIATTPKVADKIRTPARVEQTLYDYVYNALRNQKDDEFEPPKDANQRDRLLWLQERRGDSTHVQCVQCGKWRLLEVKDPVDIPINWVCKMNPDPKVNDCRIPQEEVPVEDNQEIVHTVYTAGSLVWAKMTGYPWWPAMVNDCPDNEIYYWLKSETSKIPSHYMVVFFDSEPVTRCWVKAHKLISYKHNPDFDLKFTTTKKQLLKRIRFAKKQANEAMLLDVGERLRKFSFVSRWCERINTPRSSISSGELENFNSKKRRMRNSTSGRGGRPRKNAKLVSVSDLQDAGTVEVTGGNKKNDITRGSNDSNSIETTLKKHTSNILLEDSNKKKSNKDISTTKSKQNECIMKMHRFAKCIRENTTLQNNMLTGSQNAQAEIKSILKNKTLEEVNNSEENSFSYENFLELFNINTSIDSEQKRKEVVNNKSSDIETIIDEGKNKLTSTTRLLDKNRGGSNIKSKPKRRRSNKNIKTVVNENNSKVERTNKSGKKKKQNTNNNKDQNELLVEDQLNSSAELQLRDSDNESEIVERVNRHTPLNKGPCKKTRINIEPNKPKRKRGRPPKGAKDNVQPEKNKPKRKRGRPPKGAKDNVQPEKNVSKVLLNNKPGRSININNNLVEANNLNSNEPVAGCSHSFSNFNDSATLSEESVMNRIQSELRRFEREMILKTEKVIKQMVYQRSYRQQNHVPNENESDSDSLSDEERDESSENY